MTGDALVGPLEGFISRMEWRPTGGRIRVVPATLGEWMGAAHNTIHRL